MHIPKNVNVKVAVGLLLIAVILSVSIAYFVFAATPSSTFWVSSGVYPGAPSYTIWREGSSYFAKDANGYNAFSGTIISDVIQNCLDEANTGANANVELFFQDGAYVFTNYVNVSLCMKIDGWEAEFTTTTEDLVMFYSTKTSNTISISNIYVHFETTNGTFLYAPNGLKRSHFDNMVIFNDAGFNGSVFWIEETSFENVFQGCTINNGYYLLYYKGSELTLNNNKFGSNNWSNVVIDYAAFTNIIGNGFEQVILSLENGHTNSIIGNFFSKSPNSAINLYQTRHTQIVGNAIWNITDFRGNPLYAIQVWGGEDLEGKYSKWNVISQNTIYVNVTNAWGIYETQYANYNIYTDNICYYLTGYGIYITGANSTVTNSWNGTTWIS